jgi:hypothetical protein
VIGANQVLDVVQMLWKGLQMCDQIPETINRVKIKTHQQPSPEYYRLDMRDRSLP